MRSILFDEMSAQEASRAREYLERHARPSGVDGLYWIPLERDLWSEAQLAAHHDEQERLEAQSFRFAVELGPDWVRFEMLVRSEGLRNLGGGWANARQSLFLLAWAEEMVRQL